MKEILITLSLILLVILISAAISSDKATTAQSVNELNPTYSYEDATNIARRLRI